MQFLLAKRLLVRNSNSLSLKNTFYQTTANLNFTHSKCCTTIIKMVQFQRNRMCRKFHIRIQFFVHSKSVICSVLQVHQLCEVQLVEKLQKIGLHMASNCPITVCLLNSFFAFLCQFLFPSSPKHYLTFQQLDYCASEAVYVNMVYYRQHPDMPQDSGYISYKHIKSNIDDELTITSQVAAKIIFTCIN